MNTQLSDSNFLITTVARLESLSCCPQGRTLDGLWGACTLAVPGMLSSPQAAPCGVHLHPAEHISLQQKQGTQGWQPPAVAVAVTDLLVQRCRGRGRR